MWVMARAVLRIISGASCNNTISIFAFFSKIFKFTLLFLAGSISRAGAHVIILMNQWGMVLRVMLIIRLKFRIALS